MRALTTAEERAQKHQVRRLCKELVHLSTALQDAKAEVARLREARDCCHTHDPETVAIAVAWEAEEHKGADGDNKEEVPA